MKCFACGEQIRDEARFCPYCGKDQNERPAENRCLHCDQPLAPGARFCGHCGGDQNKMPEMMLAEEPVATPEPEVAEEVAVMEEFVSAGSAQEPVAEEETAPVEELTKESAEEPVEEPIAEEISPEPVVPVEPTPVVQPQPIPAPEPVPNQYNPVSAYQPQPVVMPPVQPVVQPVYYPAPPVRPAFQLPNERALWKMILLSVLTLGIYPFVIWCKISMEINVVASRYDGKWTMHYMCMALLAPLTLMIYPLVWIHGLCNRIGDELIRRRINYKFSAATYWLWCLLYPMLGAAITVALFLLLPMLELDAMLVYLASAATSLLTTIGPFVYLHKNMKAMNLLNTDYNERG